MCGPDDIAPPRKAYSTQPCLLPAPTSSDAKAGDLIVERFPVTFEGYEYRHAHIAYLKGRRPAPLVLVHPNYAGLKQFDIDQAAFLARCGYVGFAVDLYQETAEYAYSDRNPAPGGVLVSDTGSTDPSTGRYPEKQAFLDTKQGRAAVRRHGKGAFDAYMRQLRQPKAWRGLMKAHLDVARAHPAVHPTLAGAVGYCFGGQCVLEQVRAGHPLQAVVSFHGLLHSRPTHAETPYDSLRRLTQAEYEREVDVPALAYNTRCKVLVEHGDLDPEVPRADYDAWRAEMDAAGIDWRFHNHARTPHGFALAPGVWSTAYTEAADRRSTLSMLSLFAEVWPDFEQLPVATNACGTRLGQSIVTLARL